MEMLMLLDGILVLRSLSCKRQRISVLYAREGIGDIVYSDRQSQLHMDLEVYMRESPSGKSQTIVRSQRPGVWFTEAKASVHGDGASAGDWQSYPVVTQRRLSE